MSLQIQNEQLIATFQTRGAELVSLKAKKTGIEYIWQGDPVFWSRHAPILFPIVGRLKNDQYKYQGQTYHLPQHGFARDQEFIVSEQSTEKISFLLKSSPDTKQNYPFDFELILSYELAGEGLTSYYEVKNSGKQELLFSIGGHPAFNIPLEQDLQFDDYYLHFSPQKSRLMLPLDGPLVNQVARTLGQTNTDIQLSHALFENDALIYETKGLNSYSIRSDKSEHSVTLTYNEMPFVGIWSPYPKEAPFVCIEPWCGIADTTTADGQLENKLGIQKLAVNDVFKQKYCITVK